MIDVVVVVPGIMGSRLVDTVSGQTLWGVSQIAGLKTAGQVGLRRWADGQLAALAVTEQERGGDSRRVRPDGLIKEPVWGPTLRMNFGYRRLTQHLGKIVLDPDALLEFGYDWRLSVEHNGRLLAGAIDRHLTSWRSHPALVEQRRTRPDTADPRVVIVAHSMGGLVVRAMGLQAGALDPVRMVITVGTPFRGSVDAVTMVNSGRNSIGLPLAPGRTLAYTLPGLHDLLPTYRCRFTGDDLVALDPSTVGSLGGDAELARESFERQARLETIDLPGMINLAGSHQPTDICFALADGVIETRRHGYERHPDGRLARDAAGRLIPLELHGDSTVQWQSARLGAANGYPQKHGALQATASLIRNVEAQIEGRPLTDGLAGRSELGVDLAEYGVVGSTATARISGATSAGEIAFVVKTVDGETLPRARVLRDGDDYLVEFPLSRPGLHVLAISRGVESILDGLLALEPDGAPVRSAE